MNRNMILKAVFSGVIALVLMTGLATASSGPASGQNLVPPPPGGCPTTHCTSPLGLTFVGTCSGPGPESCNVFVDRRGAYCKAVCVWSK